MLPRPGQIWKLNDPEQERFVRVSEVNQITGSSVHSVTCLDVRRQKATSSWVVTRLERSYFNANRFQGQPGGFVLHKKEK